MCDECVSIREDAKVFANGVYDWAETQPDEPQPDGLVALAASTAAVVGKVASDPLQGNILGELVMETVRVVFTAGLRAAREETDAPNGEGALAEVMMVPVQVNS